MKTMITKPIFISYDNYGYFDNLRYATKYQNLFSNIIFNFSSELNHNYISFLDKTFTIKNIEGHDDLYCIDNEIPHIIKNHVFGVYEYVHVFGDDKDIAKLKLIL